MIVQKKTVYCINKTLKMEKVLKEFQIIEQKLDDFKTKIDKKVNIFLLIMSLLFVLNLISNAS